ncbi:MAG: Wadjet anti-phage system protein JetA family protein [Spirochaetaceae bacterium]
MGAVFEYLPEGFFSPLASPNRRHYAELLLRYYELFLEYHSGVERPVVVDAFIDYLASVGPGELAEEEGGSGEAPGPETEADPRAAAQRFLRNLCAYGWMDEEELLDFSRVINLRDTARPFLEALHQVSHGASLEYESHVVAIYSSLESDAAEESGEHAVLIAHRHTRLLMESLKLLDQNIRGHLQHIFSQDATVPELLHAHYDLYMHEVVDRAYTRLKTSDNLSRYRPRINRRISAFLKDNAWMRRTAERLSLIKRSSTEAAEEELRRMLVEIRDDLQSIDPLLERIDDRNRRYSRLSTERIRSQIHADQSLAARIATIVRAWTDESYPPEAAPESLVHTILRLRALGAESLYTRRHRSVTEAGLQRREGEPPDAEIAERELVLRARKQLSPAKIAGFLSAAAPNPGDRARAEALVGDIDSYIKLLYAGAYAEGRGESFPYQVEWGDELVRAGSFRFVDHTFVRRFSRG